MNMLYLRILPVEGTSLEGERHMAYQDTAVRSHHVCAEEEMEQIKDLILNMQHCIYSITALHGQKFVDT